MCARQFRYRMTLGGTTCQGGAAKAVTGQQKRHRTVPQDIDRYYLGCALNPRVRGSSPWRRTVGGRSRTTVFSVVRVVVTKIATMSSPVSGTRKTRVAVAVPLRRSSAI